MGAKRSHQEANGLGAMHASRQAALQPQDQPRPRKKPRRNEPTPFNPKSVNALKKKIRDISRLLERSETLPAGLRIENERALESYKQDLVAADDEKRRQRMIKKYHMVRFFERQKATRLLKKLRKRRSGLTTGAELEDLKQQIYDAEVDLNYTLYCPLDQKYTALYANKEADDEEAPKAPRRTLTRDKPPLWVEVERHMKAGTLNQLRNGVTRSDGPKTSGVASEATKKSRKKTREDGKTSSRHKGQSTTVAREEGADAEQGEGSDGGFFEE